MLTKPGQHAGSYRGGDPIGCARLTRRLAQRPAPEALDRPAAKMYNHRGKPAGSMEPTSYCSTYTLTFERRTQMCFPTVAKALNA